MGKKFLGLGGTDHFWDRAKAWILNQITSAVAAKIAEIVANAPEDLDTLKEIADWISAHADDAAAMNTQIQTNKDNIAALQTSVAGKADKVHTHTKAQITDFPTSLKNPNALTVNGKTYDGSSAVDAGVQAIANGGTGASDGQTAFDNIVSGVRTSSNPLDDETMLFRSTSWYKAKVSDFWGYIKGKISSVLGLTKDNYGGKAATASETNFWSTASTSFEGNVNDLEIGRWYCVNTELDTVLNVPIKSGWATILTFAANNNPAFKQQLCICSNKIVIYVRVCFNNSWTNWIER